jgi:hypothetical protein
MNASSWKNKSTKSTNPSYGLRIIKSFRDSTFTPNRTTWLTVKLYLNNYANNPVVINLSSSFWGTCMELRSKEIGIWFIRNRKAHWKKNHPHQYTLVQRGTSNVFDVS